MGVPYYIRIREHEHTSVKFPPRGQLEQFLSTHFYCYSDNKLVESSDDFKHKDLHTAVTVLSERVFPQKSFHIAPGDWSVPSDEGYGWQDLRLEVDGGKCIPRYVCETMKPKINTQVSWLKVLAGASNVSECSDAQDLQPAGDPAIFWALVALSTERGDQPSQLIDMVNRGAWKRPPTLEGEHTGRIVIVEVYCDPGIPRPKDYEFPNL